MAPRMSAHRTSFSTSLSGLLSNSLLKVENPDTEDCLIAVLTNWLKKIYDVQKFGEPSWAILVKAVDSRAGGRNHALALDIAQKYNNEYYYIVY